MRLNDWLFITWSLHGLLLFPLRRVVVVVVVADATMASDDKAATQPEANKDHAFEQQGKVDMPLETELQQEKQQVGVIRVNNLDSVSDLLKDPSSFPTSTALPEYLSSFESHVTFVLGLVYSEQCAACRERMEQFVHQVPQLWQAQQEGQTTTNSDVIRSLPPPVLLLLSIDEQDSSEQMILTKQLESFGVIQLPALLWMVRDTAGNAFVLEFSARLGPNHLTAQEILQTYQHVQTRLLLLSEKVSFFDDKGQVLLQPTSFPNTKGSSSSTTTTNEDESAVGNKTLAPSLLEDWVLQNGSDLFHAAVQTFPGPLLDSERDYAHWLWYQQGETAHDGFLLLGQCRTPGHENADEGNDILRAFDRLTAMWLDRRDVVMVVLSDCLGADEDNGKVFLWRVFPDAFTSGSLDLCWDAAEKVVSVNSSLDDAARAFKNALVQATTPSMLWLDRETTAPIAFPLWRKVHAILAIDVHRNAPVGTLSMTAFDQKQAMVLQEFRQLCRDHQRNPLTEDLVCLVVPSTDIRTLTIFGVDIWTPLDVAAWQSQNDPYDYEILPVFFITDQRFGGTQRHYLEHDMVENLGRFWIDFWDGKLTPFPKSSSSSTTNKAGVVSISAVDFQQEVLGGMSTRSNETTSSQRNKHSLVLFTSSMCGHCRRLLALWNQFGRLVQKVGWSSFLTLYQMDVSTDEVLSSDGWNETIRWVPDLIYVAPGDNPRVLRYEEKDEYGDHVVGGVKSYMDLVEWFLHVATLHESEILGILSQVRALLAEEDAAQS